eukprot:1161903-Pelagomonas_calceolata.AAC.2
MPGWVAQITHVCVQTGLGVVRNEGVIALWSGLGPSLARGFFFGGERHALGVGSGKEGQAFVEGVPKESQRGPKSSF